MFIIKKEKKGDENMKQIIINNETTNFYVTEDGRVFNQKTQHWLKGSISGGYHVFDLRYKSKKYRCYAHRLVAEAFLENTNNLPVVNHKDGNKLNNNVENLEWITFKGNNIHAYNYGLKEKTNGTNERIKYKEDLFNEQWKQYKNTTFMISTCGRIRNMKTNNILKGKIANNGYREWCLSINGKKKSYLAHRLVYETFIGELLENYVINHKDGNKLNNNVENLEQIKQSDNIIHSYYTINAHPNVKLVGKYTLDNILLEVYPSCAEAARQNIGCYANLICNVCNGKKKSHNGYIWKYINKD